MTLRLNNLQLARTGFFLWYLTVTMINQCSRLYQVTLTIFKPQCHRLGNLLLCSLLFRAQQETLLSSRLTQGWGLTLSCLLQILQSASRNKTKFKIWWMMKYSRLKNICSKHLLKRKKQIMTSWKMITTLRNWLKTD